MSVTVQSAVLSATSNILAQAITAYRTEVQDTHSLRKSLSLSILLTYDEQKPFMIDWVPVFQFFLFTVVSTPPNFLCKFCTRVV